VVVVVVVVQYRYGTSNGIDCFLIIRWTDNLPGKDWMDLFQKRWAHRISLRKPSCIKRSRGEVSPKVVREFFSHLEPNLLGVPPSRIFNYDETNFRDDPGMVTVPVLVCYSYISTGTGTYWYLELVPVNDEIEPHSKFFKVNIFTC